MQIEPKILDFSLTLQQTESLANPSEIQGMLCGLICAGQKLNGKFWFDSVLKRLKEVTPKSKAIVIEFYDLVCRQLGGVEPIGFELLLPDENQPLPVRAQALSQWCKGFLYALYLSGKDESNTPEETQTMLQYLGGLAQLDFQSLEATEIDQEAYIISAEFVRDIIIKYYQDFVGHEKISRVFH